MSSRIWTLAAACAVACVFVLAGPSDASAQGRGRGGGAGGGAGRGGGPPAGVGVDRGIGRSSDSSAGRADTGRGNASDKSAGRSDAGLERARLMRDNARRADDELRAHPSMAARLHTNARDLREGYQAALVANPNLKFGQYVAATRLAANLGGRHPNVTREAILAGLAGGDSIGRTLRNLGVGSDEAKEAERRVNREIKESKRRS
ncbi:MAG TPA: hypothetical protein VFZ44_05635 [Pyrinomonadaceae bacterium]